MKEGLTVSEAARQLDVTTIWIYVLLRNNRLKAHKDKHGHWRINASSVAALNNHKGVKHARNRNQSIITAS